MLSEQGLHTLGVDLSPESISFASQFENERLEFKVGNMLEALDFGAFDWVMNLFTSFGYFDDDGLHQKALNHMAQCLKPGGETCARLYEQCKNRGAIGTRKRGSYRYGHIQH